MIMAREYLGVHKNVAMAQIIVVEDTAKFLVLLALLDAGGMVSVLISCFRPRR